MLWIWTVLVIFLCTCQTAVSRRYIIVAHGGVRTHGNKQDKLRLDDDNSCCYLDGKNKSCQKSNTSSDTCHISDTSSSKYNRDRNNKEEDPMTRRKRVSNSSRKLPGKWLSSMLQLRSGAKKNTATVEDLDASSDFDEEDEDDEDEDSAGTTNWPNE